MKTKLTVATALAGTLLAAFLVSGSAQATSLPVLKGDAPPGIVTLVGKKGGGGGGGKYKGKGGGKHYAYKGGGGGGKYKGKGDGKHNAYKRKGGGKHYAYKGKRYSQHGNYRRYGYGLPYISYGYGGGCSWLRQQALITGSPYWWSRYYQCRRYY